MGCLLIYFLLRKVGAALFLACPLVLRAYVMITADLPLAVLLFLAFLLWWDGAAKGSIKGSIGLSRWIAIGVVLALAGLLKGPQPIAYFALGVGVFVLGRRSWWQLPGLVLAGLICAVPLALWYAAIYRPGDEGIWAAFMRVRPNLIFSGPLQASVRLLSETLPAALAAAVYLIARWFNGRDRAPRDSSWRLRATLSSRRSSSCFGRVARHRATTFRCCRRCACSAASPTICWRHGGRRSPPRSCC